jgi:hypothetical protein
MYERRTYTGGASVARARARTGAGPTGVNPASRRVLADLVDADVVVSDMP